MYQHNHIVRIDLSTIIKFITQIKTIKKHTQANINATQNRLFKCTESSVTDLRPEH